ncbi:hypothetical protein MYX78_04840 [Acidobacteria bacterium AH-259-G07]|nr:hypothetical protein [Acidobacteria bacterium AH-259-G07]
MSNSQSLNISKSKANSFQEDIERHVKRYHPQDFALAISSLIEMAVKDTSVMRRYPPHFLIHALEANCSFHRSHYRDHLTRTVIAKLVNVYHHYEEPLVRYFLSEEHSIDLFLILYFRQQFYLQEMHGADDMGRGILLFDESQYPETLAEIRRNLGFGFSDWLTFCFLVWTRLNNTNSNVFHRNSFVDDYEKLTTSWPLDQMFQLLSSTPEEAGSNYKAVRERFGVLYDPYIPSFFIEKPLLKVSHSEYVVTHKPLVLLRSIEGVYDIARNKSADCFGKEFGDAFESYVGKVLRELPEAQIYEEKQLRKYTGQKVCDYVVVGKNYVLFLESKAVEYGATLSSQNALKGDNSTTKLGGAIDQVLSTAAIVKEGLLSELLGDTRKKPYLAAVTTFRHIYLANGRMYWDQIISPSLKSTEASKWSSLFVFQPQVMSVSELESFVLVCREKQISAGDLFHEKLTQPLTFTGEWRTYLHQHKTDDYKLPLLEGVFDRFADGILERLKSGR